MAGSTYSTNLKIELMTTGENSGTWGDITNTNLGTALEQAVVGYGNVDYVSDANLTISITNSNASQPARALVLNVTSTFGSLTQTRELVVPTSQKQYIVQNNTTGGQSITVKTSAGTGITVPNGRKAHLYVNGTSVIQMFDFINILGGTIDNTTLGATTASSARVTTLNASGATTLDGTVALGNAAGDLITVPGTINSNLIFTDNTYDIGASGATRPRNLYLAGAATIGGNLSVGGTLTLTGGVNLNGNVTVGDSAADTLTINATITSNLLFTDNTYDIGASGATRPRNLFLAGNITAGGNQTLTGSLTVDSTTDTSSATTGSIQTDGGVGIAKGLYVGGNTTLGDASADTVTVNGTVTSNLIFTDNTYDIGASGATRPRNLYLAGTATLASTVSAARYIVNSTSNAGTSDISLGSYSSGAWLNTPTGTTGYLATAGTGVASWTSTALTVNAGTLSVSGTGGRGINLIGGGTGNVQIAGDGSTYAIGVGLYNNYSSISTAMSGMWAYGSSGVYQYTSLGGSAYNNGAIYMDSNKRVGVSRLPNSWLDVYNSAAVNSAASSGLGYITSVTQGTGTLTMAAGSGNQRGNVMTIYGTQGSPTTVIPYGQDYSSLGLTVAMDVAAGGNYAVYGIGSYVRTDGQGYGFTANVVNTTSSAGRINYGFLSNSVTGGNINYGFYQNGSSNYNWFNGWVGVGSNALPYGNTTYERMTIEGNTDTRSWLSVRNTNAGSSAYSGVIVNAYGNSWALEMGSIAANSNALNITKDIYGTPQVMAYMATSGVMYFLGDNQNRPVTIGGGYLRIKGESGGWQIGYYTQDSAGTIKGGFGAAGSNTTQEYNFIGPEASVSFARFNAYGIAVGATTPATSGVGITFPATQSASSGANTLDDYEEGDWTPAFLSDGGTTGTTTVTNRWGRYVKIGRQVTVNFGWTGSLSGFTGVLQVGGLPFAVVTETTYQFGGGLECTSSTATASNGSNFLFFAFSNSLYPRFTTGQTAGYLFNDSSQVNGLTGIQGTMTYNTTT